MSASDGARIIKVKWISVDDHLPPCAATVLVYVPSIQKRLRAFYLCDDYGCEEYDSGYTGWHEDTAYGSQWRVPAEVSHWMELPPGPSLEAVGTDSPCDIYPGMRVFARTRKGELFVFYVHEVTDWQVYGCKAMFGRRRKLEHYWIDSFRRQLKSQNLIAVRPPRRPEDWVDESEEA